MLMNLDAENLKAAKVMLQHKEIQIAAIEVVNELFFKLHQNNFC